MTAPDGDAELKWDIRSTHAGQVYSLLIAAPDAQAALDEATPWLAGADPEVLITPLGPGWKGEWPANRIPAR